MFKNRFLFVLGLTSVMIFSLVISSFRTGASVSHHSAANDFYQRHPELAGLAVNGRGASDYFERHPELVPASKSNVDLTDYYFRHPELSVSAAQVPIDLTDYYFRHIDDK